MDLEAKPANRQRFFCSANMSLGVNTLLGDGKKTAAKILGEAGFDIDIVEKHHHESDAPSGTALAFADSITKQRMASIIMYLTEVKEECHVQQMIGISAVRGGTIVGEHEIIFAGTDEVIELNIPHIPRACIWKRSGGSSSIDWQINQQVYMTCKM